MDKLYEAIKSFFPEFRISKNDLMNPTSSFIRDFYCRVLLDLGVEIDNVRRIQMDQLDCQDIEIIPEINLVTVIKTALPFLNFHLSDLIMPEVKRSATLMSHAMAFIQFCEMRCSANNEKIEDFQKDKMKEIELAMLKERESNRLNNIALETDSNTQLMLKMDKDITKLRNDIERLKEENERRSLVAQEAKEIIDSRESKVQSINREIQAIVGECEEIKKLLVDNPAEEQQDFDAKCRARDKVLEKKKEYQDKLKAHNENKEKLMKLAEMLNKKGMAILDEIDILQKCRDYKTSSEKVKENMDDLQKKKEKLINTIEELGNKIKNEKDNYNCKMADLEKDKNTLKEQLDLKKSDYKVKYEACMLLQKELENVLSLISNLQNECSCLVSQFIVAKGFLHDRLI